MGRLKRVGFRGQGYGGNFVINKRATLLQRKGRLTIDGICN